MKYFLLFIVCSFFVGTAISSFFLRFRHEEYYFWRTYELYKRGQVAIFGVLMSLIINTIIGLFVLGFIFGDFLFKKLVLNE